MTNLTM